MGAEIEIRTEKAHGAVDGCGGDAVKPGRLAAAVEASEEGEVDGKSLERHAHAPPCQGRRAT